ncbi:MAG: glycosyltransferase family 4 protein [Phycisphaeraceae bacterium]
MGLTVVQTVPALEAGGVERGVVEVSQALCERGHRSVVVSSGGRLVDELTRHGAEHRAMPIHRKSPATLLQVRPLRRLLRELDADVVHARSRVPAWVTYFAWRNMDPTTRPAFATSVHGLHSVSRYSRIMTLGQRVEVVSETVRRYVLENYSGTDPDKLYLNHRGVDPERFTFGYQPDDDWLERWREQYPELVGRCVLTLAGRLTRLKGHHDLFDILTKLRGLGVDAHALIVGDEDPRRRAYAKGLRDAVRNQGLADRVTFTGHRGDIREVLAVSDVVLSLSTKPESFGRSVLEAVRLGKPVVGYDHGGVGEVLATIYPQGRVPLGDTTAAARRIADLAAGDTPAPEPTDAFLLSSMLDRSVAMYEQLAKR